MSEEKKTVELKDEELDKIAGGFAEFKSFSFDDGDCFEGNNVVYKVVGNYKIVLQSEKISVVYKGSFGEVSEETTKSAGTLASYTYLGKNVFWQLIIYKMFF